MSDNKLEITIREGEYAVTIEVPKYGMTLREVAEVAVCCKLQMDCKLPINQKQEVDFHEIKEPINIKPGIKLNVPKEIHEMEKLSAEIKELTKPIAPPDDMFTVRERLPNNVVDVSTLEINSTTNEKALIRCPGCGQSHVAVIAVKTSTENYLMIYDATKKEFIFVGNEALTEEEVTKLILPDGSSKTDYYHDLQTMLPKVEDNPKDVVVYENTKIFCPVCQEINDFSAWKKAYYSPLDFFEFENPCKVCGGETLSQVNKKSKDKKTATHKCDKCGFEEEKEI